MIFKDTIIRKLSAVLALIFTVSMSGCGSDEPASGSVIPNTPVNPPVEVVAPQTAIYQANPRFYGTNQCIKAVENDLDRIVSLNVDVLWLMPIHPIGQKNSVNSPYCVKDYYGIDEKLGTLQDLQSLVSKAHQKGLKVILDWVANHTAWDNVWILTHPEYYLHDSAGNIVTVPGQSWSDVAQLDYSNPETVNAMIDAMVYWVETADIDGFRTDYTEGVPDAFWRKAITTLDSKKSGLLMLAEASKTQYYEDGFNMIYDWNFNTALQKLFTNGNVDAFFKSVEERNSIVPKGKSILRYAFNHDTASENSINGLFGSSKGTLAAYVLVAMTGGTPMIYSAMDVDGLSGNVSFFGHKDYMHSQVLTDAYAAINAGFKATAAARSGKMTVYSAGDVAMFSCVNGDRIALVVVNPKSSERSANIPMVLRGEKMTDHINGGEVSLPVQIQLPGYGYAIYSK